MNEFSRMDCDGSFCHAECELRHRDNIETSLRRDRDNPAVQSHVQPYRHSNVVICAAPERSGSTWLYNAIRLLYRDFGMICDSYWIHALRKDKIEERLHEAERVGGIVLIKTHEWHESYGNWLVQTFRPTILLTHRDLRGVIKSYRRVGWSHNLPTNYVEDHLKWKDVCALDLKYENIVSDGMAQLQVLAQHLIGRNVCSTRQDTIERVHVQLLNLDKASDGGFGGGDGVNQVTKMWPYHISDETRDLLKNPTLVRFGEERPNDDKKAENISDMKCNSDELALMYPDYMEVYGYGKAK